ncbi:MAG: anhydro-N-acetylmuramic acid kinase [Bacteroidota bacterium]
MKNDIIIGLMSGTSMDGLDLCACEFKNNKNSIEFRIIHADTIPYSEEWRKKLWNAPELSGEKLIKLNHDLGTYYGKTTLAFIERNHLRPTLISSHGHTIFHQPQNGFTLQIGSGANIAALTGIDTICDFRSKDVALGGQGAPLVPIGDQFLFSNYEACLNLGGIANISFFQEGKQIAFDICPVNMALNYYAEKLNLNYDNKGQIASTGKIIQSLLDDLNRLSFYSEKGPKSLGKEWFDKYFLPVINESEKQNNSTIADILRTIVEHISIQHSQIFSENNIKGPVLISGGGALNDFLISRIISNSSTDIYIPDSNVINYKEALIFAFLGWLYCENKTNTLSSATGAKKDSIGGALYKGL